MKHFLFSNPLCSKRKRSIKCRIFTWFSWKVYNWSIWVKYKATFCKKVVVVFPFFSIQKLFVLCLPKLAIALNAQLLIIVGKGFEYVIDVLVTLCVNVSNNPWNLKVGWHICMFWIKINPIFTCRSKMWTKMLKLKNSILFWLNAYKLCLQ